MIRDITDIHKTKQKVDENSKYITELSVELKDAIMHISELEWNTSYKGYKTIKNYLTEHESESMPAT